MTTDFSIQSVGDSSITALQIADNKTDKPNVEKQELPKAAENADTQPDVAKLQETLAAHDIDLQFTCDEETKALVVKLVNQQTGEQIRQIPTESSLKISAQLGKLQGLIFSAQV